MARPPAAVWLFAVVFPAVVGAIVFVSAGTWELPFVWAILAIVFVLYLALAAFADPGLVQERVRPGPGNRDTATRRLGGILLIAHWVLAGLDVGRLHWTPVPWQLQAAGVVVYAAAVSVTFWAMKANPFYSSVVRIQTDRGQHAVAAGPYRYVRHPGYAATLVALISGGVALGSWIALVPALGFAALFVRRTLIEDRLLREELPGYLDYAQSVRYRLIPGVF
jgi:protein-S-isoprenylcysteine O-methyltransferase Ste14